MSTLETLKNNYAQEQGYEDWDDLIEEIEGMFLQEHFRVV